MPASGDPCVAGDPIETCRHPTEGASALREGCDAQRSESGAPAVQRATRSYDPQLRLHRLVGEASRTVSSMGEDAEFARQVIDGGQYLVLATADPAGNPWPTPVWFAREGRKFVWVSRPEARHSNNIATRPTVGLV